MVPSAVEGKSTTLRGTTVVARTEDGSPAQEAGLLRGDIILNVDGTPADNLSPEEIAALSRSIHINLRFLLMFSMYEYWFSFQREGRYQSQLSSRPRR